MSDHIPLEIQLEIIKNLPVKSLLQFRCVSKQWKSLIDDSNFTKNYHVNQTNPRHHLLVWENKVGTVPTFTSIIDDNTFPKQKFPLTAPESLNLLRVTETLGSANGLLCFCGFYGVSVSKMVVIWNPCIRKCVSIFIPKPSPDGHTTIGFGVCSDTSDPTLVKIWVNRSKKPCAWVVEVFTLSTRVWKTLYMGVPFKSCHLMLDHVFVDGIIYWRNAALDGGLWSNYIISFDLKREKFDEESLPERLARSHGFLVLTKANESLRFLEYYNEGKIWVCGVWTKKHGVSKPFTKIYTLNVDGKSLLNSALGWKSVLGFRNNGEVVLEVEDDNDRGYVVEVYEPSSGRINGVGINGKYGRFSVRSYTETLLLLHESNSTVH